MLTNSKIMNKITNILNEFTKMIPFLLLNDKISTFTMCMFIFLPPILEKMVKYIYENYFTDYTYDIYELTPRGNYNTIHRYMSYILEKHDLLKDVKYIECNAWKQNENKEISKPHHKTIYYENVPCLDIGINGKIHFDHNNIKLDITSDILYSEDNGIKKEKKYYRLTSPKYENIKNFLEYLKAIQCDYVDEMIFKKKTQYYYYDTSSKKWIGTKINVNKTFETLFLDDIIKNKLINDIQNFVNNNKKYEHLGIPHKLGYLLHGMPGNGKSSLVYVLSKTYNKSIYKVNLSVSKSTFINQIQEIPQGSIVIFEDIDTCPISNDRTIAKELPEKDQKEYLDKFVLGDILEILDGYCFLEDCIIITTTNHIDKLDSALIRSGRMDHKLEFNNATPTQIFQIIKYYYKKDIDITVLKSIDISVSELINTHVIPNLDNYDYIHNFLF